MFDQAKICMLFSVGRMVQCDLMVKICGDLPELRILGNVKREEHNYFQLRIRAKTSNCEFKPKPALLERPRPLQFRRSPIAVATPSRLALFRHPPAKKKRRNCISFVTAAASSNRIYYTTHNSHSRIGRYRNCELPS